MSNMGIAKTITSILDMEVESAIRNVLVPKFWKHFIAEGESHKVKPDMNIAAFTDTNALFFTFIYAIDELYDAYQCLEMIKPRLFYLNQSANSTSNLNTKITLHNALLAQLPPSFNNFVCDFYCVHFRLFTKDSTLSLNTLGMSHVHYSDIFI